MVCEDRGELIHHVGARICSVSWTPVGVSGNVSVAEGPMLSCFKVNAMITRVVDIGCNGRRGQTSALQASRIHIDVN